MANIIELDDFSFETVKQPKLYEQVKEGGTIILDTSICDVINSKKEIEPIMEIKRGRGEKEVIIITFGYVGRFSHLGVNFNISYRFGNFLLDRMIKKVNDFDIKPINFEAEKSEKSNKDSDNLAMKILYLNFILKLEKLSILGLPKSYIRVEQHGSKLKGQLDINRFIKKDMPFQGQISSTSYEQHYIQEIVDVLYRALVIVENSMKEEVTKRLFQIRNLINHHANKTYIDERTIQNAICHKSIQNSLYSDFKDILEIASFIIKSDISLLHKKDKLFKGIIFDVSLLWERYLYKLLKENCEKDDWEVVHEEICEVYEDMFYQRVLKPDIVIKNENSKKVLVFDAKSKSMKFRGTKDGVWDLDRNDFFQIHTYISYYKNQGYDVIAGGLLYPIESNFNIINTHADSWLGDSKTKFIVDGIELVDAIKDNEKKFIERIEILIKQDYTKSKV